jgi:dihydrofolate synthase/folylpolyglutamate synthase
MPALIGAHQVQNAGIAIATLRYLGKDETAFEGAMLNANRPARLQNLSHGPLIDAAVDAELWLDGGHNKAAGHALAEALGRLPDRNLYLVVGMLNTKDATGYMEPLKTRADKLFGVSIPGEAATLSAQETVDAARKVGFDAQEAPDFETAVADIVKVDPTARILICGSLYLAGNVLQLNG